jgi:hypothetical protein
VDGQSGKCRLKQMREPGGTYGEHGFSAWCRSTAQPR